MPLSRSCRLSRKRTKICIRTPKKSIESLALAPLPIVPEFQGKGVGSQLIAENHRLAKEMGQ